MPRTISILTSNDGEEFQVVNVIENSDVFVKTTTRDQSIKARL